jgi:hypothetical protein
MFTPSTKMELTDISVPVHAQSATQAKSKVDFVLF